MRAGSPGMTRAIAKISIETPISTIREVPSRFARRRMTGSIAELSEGVGSRPAAKPPAFRVRLLVYFHQPEGEAHPAQSKGLALVRERRHRNALARREDRILVISVDGRREFPQPLADLGVG